MPDAAFDRAYSQNVVMNIADKRRFYRAAFRALRPGGLLALSNVCAGSAPPHFPVPWAAPPAPSVVAAPEEPRAARAAAGFAIGSFRDPPDALRPAQLREVERLGREAPPPLGIHLIMGERIGEMRMNSAKSAAEGHTRTIEALVRKPL